LLHNKGRGRVAGGPEDTAILQGKTASVKGAEKRGKGKIVDNKREGSNRTQDKGGAPAPCTLPLGQGMKKKKSVVIVSILRSGGKERGKFEPEGKGKNMKI